MISIVIVRNPYLSFSHLEFLIQSLNSQTNQQFNTFWLDQTDSPDVLLDELKNTAHFEWFQFSCPSQIIVGVHCWELISKFDFLTKHPAFRPYFTYFHMECLPESDFVAALFSLIPDLNQTYGPHWVAMIMQLWSNLDVGALFDGLFLEQLRLSDLKTWQSSTPYSLYAHQPFGHYEQPRWEEDAFFMPTSLALKLKLFSAAKPDLFFQDIFDIFSVLESDYFDIDIRWLRLPQVVLYHLRHPRVFLEFRPAFMRAVQEHPALFEHLALYDLAFKEMFYHEESDFREQRVSPQELVLIEREMRSGKKGSLTLWLKAIREAGA